ncbi:sensor histidine kinase [Chryseobacterium sp.]|uniref:sensor histidine kinase n=1 Tax=Chryseobacterium sp. TaxID=1871047 RepID=UPI0011C82C21|nr:HAMP domain-containing sensor histidine kinase [Chryseobacterium sp.]TXF78829.1 HAMP domain-containing histidine kinase [Chryseobacterium sp.]
MKLSFKKRIAAYNLVAIAALLAFAFAVIYAVVYYTSYKHLDDDIISEKTEVFSNLDWNDDAVIMNKMPEWEEAEHRQIEVNPTFIQIVDSSGKTLFKSANLQDDHFLFNPRNKNTVFYNTTLYQQKIRQGQFPIRNDQGRIIGQLTIGVSQQESYNVLHNLLLVLVTTYIFIVSILYFIMIFVASKAIAPVHQLIQSASQISYANISSRLTLPDNEDEIRQLATTINDLLSRLESSFYQQKQFTADASHEMQTPLAAIKGTIEVLLRKPRTSQRYEEKMREILLQTDRLSQLHDQLLQLARLESPLFEVNKQEIPLKTAVDRSVKTNAALISSNMLNIQNHIASDTVVWADPVLFEMVIDNLISNAAKYNKRGGSIFIHWQTGSYTLTITDEGIGIDSDQLPLLFNRFFRADDSRSSLIPGNGLGLSIAKRLCDAQHISLTVSSVKYQGTTFHLQFSA